MAFTERLPVRFDDVDFAQIVYFPKFFGFCHWVFEDFFGKHAGVTYAELLTKRRVGFPTVNAEAQFKAPLRFGQECRIVMETIKLGRSSLTNRYRMYEGETSKLCADVRLVHVATNLDDFVSVDVPEDIRVAFLKHLAV